MNKVCLVGWGCKMHQLLLPSSSVLDMMLNNLIMGFQVMLDLWGMQSTTSLPSLPVLLWPRVLAPDRVLSMGQIELNCVLMLN